MNVYKYGLSNTIEAISEALTNALNTGNRVKKAEYIGEAYGMIRAIDFLIDETDEKPTKTNKTNGN